MRAAFGGPPLVDQFQLIDKYGISSGFMNTTGRTQVSPTLDPQERTAVLLSFGQSQSANHGQGLYAVQHPTKVQNLNIHNGLLYQLVEPVLGPTFTINGFGGWSQGYGSYMGCLGDRLIDDDIFDRVIHVPISIGGVPVIDYTPGGVYSHWLMVAMRRIRAAGLPVTAFLWHHGETDALPVALGGVETPQAVYEARLRKIIEFCRGFPGIGAETAPFFVPQATWVAGVSYPTIRAAQAAVVDPGKFIYAGPDFDTLDGSYRADTLHFSLSGNGYGAVSAMWSDAISAVF